VLKRFLSAVLVMGFIFIAHCQAEETSINESTAVVEENNSFFSSAKNFFVGLFSSEDKKISNEVKRANIEDFENVSENELAEAVVAYVNANPDKRDALINYASAAF